MLHTVLLLDGSEAMNSGADYVPSYLLASRAPLLRFVSSYLDYTPLASLGVVVMRDGVSRRLCGCTTNSREIVDVLERDYFLHGGSGSMSLENGLRMALSELVDLRRVASKRAALSSHRRSAVPHEASHPAGAEAKAATEHNTDRLRRAYAESSSHLVRPRVVILSASVTLIDPTDVMRVIRTVAAFGITIDIISFTGAVHAFDACVRATGGTLYCPLSYDHLQRIVVTCAMGGGEGEGKDGAAAAVAPRARLIPMGFPVYLTRSAPALRLGGARNRSKSSMQDEAEYYLACPQCYFVQSAVPSTCPLCRLLLCSVPMMYTTFVAHNRLVPPTRCDAQGEDDKAKAEEEEAKHGATDEARSATNAESDSVSVAAPMRCGLCTCVCMSDAAEWRRCESCETVRCTSCDEFVTTVLRLCPGCVSTR